MHERMVRFAIGGEMFRKKSFAALWTLEPKTSADYLCGMWVRRGGLGAAER